MENKEEITKEELAKENPLLYGDEKLDNNIVGASKYLSEYAKEHNLDVEDEQLRMALSNILYSYAKRVVDTDSLQKELAVANSKHLRLYAEFDNYRKRTTKEKADILASGGESAIKAVLPSLDNFERALTSNNDEGVKLIYNGLLKNLENKGLKVMEVLGTDFTPELHEAIAQVPSEELKGKVVDVLEKGYLLNGKVIRFAKVVVGS